MNRISVLFLTFLLFIVSSLQPHLSFAGTVYFYNPETNTSSFTTLKTAFDTYLSTQGTHQFQPFDNPDTFEEVLKSKKGNIYLLSSWHYAALRQKKIPLEIVLVGSSKGNTMQSKVLSAKKEITDVNMLKETVIAGAGAESYLRAILQQILGVKNKALADHIKILSVPKDIDALLSVGFGVATAAISAESSLNKLSAINPNQFQQLHTLGMSEKNYLLIAATLEKPNVEENQLMQILNKMNATEAGEKDLNLLGLDGWKAL